MIDNQLQYFKKIKKTFITLIHSKQSKKIIQKIIWILQKNKLSMNNHFDEFFS